MDAIAVRMFLSAILLKIFLKINDFIIVCILLTLKIYIFSVKNGID